jgi:hypothetical protein
MLNCSRDVMCPIGLLDGEEDGSLPQLDSDE